MNDFRIEKCLDPEPYVHMVVVDSSRWFNRARLACLCGFRTVWVHPSQVPHPSATTHPNMETTVSRTDLRPYLPKQ